MATKVKLIQLAQETLAGGDVSASIRGKYHLAVVELYLAMAWADILQDLFDSAGNDLTVFDNLSKRYECTIDYNQDIELKFFKLPISLIPLRPKQAGIRSISMLKGQQKAFAPIQNSSIPMWDELEAMQVDTETCFYMLEENEIICYRNAPQIGSKILLKAIPSFTDLKDGDDVFIPGGKNEMLFQRMFSFMDKEGNVKDNYNDNNSFQPNKQ